MKSRRPKVLHTLAGRPMLAHVLDTVEALQPAAVHIVYGFGGDAVPRALAGPGRHWHLQEEQLGTGHAVAQALPAVADEARVLVLYGDVPLLRTDTLAALLASWPEGGIAVLTARLEDPSGYGRIVRDASGTVERIVEERDATDSERAIDEVNTGILTARAADLRRWVGALRQGNAQGEYYLTDCVALARADGRSVVAVPVEDVEEVHGVNDRVQLAHCERVMQRRIARELMLAGVTVRDPDRLDVRGRVEAARDVEIDVGVVLEGEVRLGEGVRIGVGCVLRDVTVEAGTEILPYCVLEQARIGAGCRIGPFSRIRPGVELAEGVHVGNFVEIKNSRIARGSKINHLSYVGDTDMGSGVNIGAGTITCNYDGAYKHRTRIGDDAFIGSNTALVAPVEVGRGATIGAGSVITRDAPEGELTLARARQTTVPGWERPRKPRS
jgi:bifunctional UDP-N-acetylglucosamine pyrophosphorylase/glucosamine-1-phosphate N-acetyltransferase